MARVHIATVRALDTLLDRVALPSDVVVYRGLANLAALIPPVTTFPRTKKHLGYLSTSLSRQVAVEGFVDADLDGGGVLRIAAPAGCQALWVPAVGKPDLAYEEEVPFPSGTFLTFARWRVRNGTAEVDCEVVA